MTDYKKLIAQNIKIDGVAEEEIYSLITVPQDESMGDYCLPCFKFAKALRKSPLEIADFLAGEFAFGKYFEKAEAVAGYLNIKLSRAQAIEEILDGVLEKGAEFLPKKALDKTICIDYSSINIAKPFHIGHLPTTVIGGSLYRIFKYLGYNVVGINHLGDWGTQFGKLIVAFKKWSSTEKVEKDGIYELLNIYVKFHDEAKQNPALDDEARAWFKKIESGDTEALQIFGMMKTATLKEVDKIYKRLGIEFDSYNGESFYNDKMDSVIAELEEKKLLSDSEGARVVDLEEYGMPPCLILKSDGASLYATRDLAAALYRKKTYNFYKNLYVVAYQQNLHFNQIFKVLNLMGKDFAEDCVHVAFGMVSLENAGALSTRKGNVIFLKDVLDTAVQKTAEIIEAKNPSLENKEKVAEDVGTGAVVFGALSSARIKDMVFSYDKSLNFDGETAPYIQYTHARCCSILQKATLEEAPKTDLGDLCTDEAYSVIKLLGSFDTVVLAAAEKYEPSFIARYLVDLAQSFNRFYLSGKVLGNGARLKLTEAVKNTLKNGLKLLLINAPEKM